jgi:hypothetical protein
MLAFDLERRLWSGRLAELFGEKPWDDEGLSASDLDVFLRLLESRRQAERLYRRLDAGTRDLLQAYARGVNAWIDHGDWRDDPDWRRLDSRPRLWGPSDSVLLAIAAPGVDGVPEGAPEVAAEAWKRGWTEAWDGRIRALWGALRDDGLRAPGAAGGGIGALRLRDGEGRDRTMRCGIPTGFRVLMASDALAPAAPRIAPEEIDSDADHQRVLEPNGRILRLRARHASVPVRGGSPRRPWLRWSLRGPLVSDLLTGAEGALPPAGTVFVWDWRGRGEPWAAAGAALRTPLAPDHPWRRGPAEARVRRFGAIRLVPLDGGA